MLRQNILNTLKSGKNACHFQQRRIIDVSTDGKDGQKGAAYGCTRNAPPQLKMNSFTPVCLLCTFGWQQIKEEPIQGQEPRLTVFFIGYFFLFSTALKTSLANAQAVCEGGEEEESRRQEE